MRGGERGEAEREGSGIHCLAEQQLGERATERDERERERERGGVSGLHGGVYCTPITIANLWRGDTSGWNKALLTASVRVAPGPQKSAGGGNVPSSHPTRSTKDSSCEARGAATQFCSALAG